MKAPLPMDDQTIREGKVFALLSYLSILCIIPLIIKKENPFVFFHGKQGLVLFVMEVAFFILHILLGPWILKLGIFLCGAASFVGIIAVLKGEQIKLPLISGIANEITL